MKNSLIFNEFQDSNIAAWIADASDATMDVLARIPMNVKKAKLDIFKFIAVGAGLALGAAQSNAQTSVQPLNTIEFARPSLPSATTLSFASIDLRHYSAELSLPENNLQASGSVALGDALPPETKQALGGGGLSRLEAFAKLQPGWDDGDGLGLQVDSLGMMNRFWVKTQNAMPQRLGLFMSQDGNLLANWPDSSGRIVEIEFFADRLSVFSEASGQTIEIKQLSESAIETVKGLMGS